MTDGQPPPMIAVDLNPEVPGVGYPCHCSPQWHCTPVRINGWLRLREWHCIGCEVTGDRAARDPLNLDAGRPVA